MTSVPRAGCAIALDDVADRRRPSSAVVLASASSSAARWPFVLSEACIRLRVDLARLSRLQEAAKGVLEKGLFEPETLYVLQAGTADKVAGRVRQGRDLLRKVDGFWVLAPGWYDRGSSVLQVSH